MSTDYEIYRHKYINAVTMKHKVPVDVSLELSSYCTNTCGYCYHADFRNLPFKRGHMGFDLARKIISECAEHGVHSLKTNYRGESTMNPNFRNITKFAKARASGATLIDRITNSNFNFRLDREDIFEGLSYQTKVKISFDSFIPEVFEKQRRGSKFDRTIANIDKFYNLPGRDNIMVIQCVRTNANKDEDLVGEIKRRWPSALYSVRDCVEGRVSTDISDTVVKHRDFSDRRPCIQAFARLMIHHDGHVSACCPDIRGEIKLGDANTQTIIELFNSPEALRLRGALSNKSAFEKGPCRTCSSFESYSNYTPNLDS